MVWAILVMGSLPYRTCWLILVTRYFFFFLPNIVLVIVIVFHYFVPLFWLDYSVAVVYLLNSLILNACFLSIYDLNFRVKLAMLGRWGVNVFGLLQLS